jgi:hypothetical protein
MKSLLRNKNVLYVVMFLAVTNFLAYLINRNWNAAVMFALIAYLTTYFSKNMIVVLSVALVSTNMIMATRRFGIVEGMENKKEAPKSDEKSSESASSSVVSDKKDESKQDINYAATVEKAYEDLDGLIGKDGIDKMTQDTAKLVDQQNKLLKNLENMAPLLENTGKLMSTLPMNGMGDIQGSIQSIVNNLKGISSKDK